LAHRRQSAAKLASMGVAEAPITKALNLILAAKENCPPYVAAALDKVCDILQSSDAVNLFSPEVDTERRRRTDAVATDLLGALLAVRT
jgi:hypothetical protein